MGDTRRGVRATRLLAVLAIVASALLSVAVQPTNAAPPASYTGTNAGIDGSGHCKNGSGIDPVNCNMYDGKEFVWLNGGPVGAALGDGSYFFAVMAPGTQANPNDGSAGNLSDDFDAYGNRTFSVASGVVTYGGSHDLDGTKIRLVDYADTPNNGGVYILAICGLSSGYPVAASSCKYDAFKVKDDDENPNPPASDLTVTKDAAGSYDTTYTWDIAKAVDKTYVEASGGNVTFNYTLTLTPDAGTPGNYTVSGTISVFNPNVDSNLDTVAVEGVDVTDELSDGTVCTVTGGNDATLSTFKTDFPYSCSLTGAPQGDLDNTATATWPTQLLDNGAELTGSDADFMFETIAFTEGDTVDECVDVVDSFEGADPGDDKGQICVDSSSKEIKYSRDIPVPTTGCDTFDNTATLTTNDTAATDSASQSVEICKLVTGGHTIGFWQNKNGQAVITGGLKTGNVCNVGAYLETLNPFKDLVDNATCPQVATYVTNVIKAASAKGAAMNAMLKAQMLGTALAAFFSQPVNNGLYGAPASLGPQMIDLTDLGTGAAFGGGTCMSVNALLAYAATSPNPFTSQTNWYGQNKTTQGYAKDTFDAINNNAAITC